MKGLFSALLLMVAVAGCAPAPEAPDAPAALTPEDEAAIRALIGQWDASWSDGDPTTTAPLYADDYVEMRVNAVVGREAAQEMISGFWDDYTYSDVTSTVMRIDGQGDLAYAWTEINNHYTAADGEPRIQRGNVLWVVKREDSGQWRFAAGGFQAASAPDTLGT
ncbi:MAG: SgcJ/EcaC family oxidoreductase [Gemmatimonadales bacterium]|jgi:uncharacterized protein (TIGR02246 family)|nr:MAG: SgcJ/EcaC family oxidoreductase [Gemmatimonadales bacterium]